MSRKYSVNEEGSRGSRTRGSKSTAPPEHGDSGEHRFSKVCAEHGEEVRRISRRGSSVYPKNEQTREWLSKALENMFVGSQLDQTAMKKVVDACQRRGADKEELLIRQGDEVSMHDAGMYLLESGMLSVYKHNNREQAPGPCVKKCRHRGDVVGELAVLYNAPRSASVIVDTPCVLWSVDRGTFLAAKQESAERRIDTYTQLVQNVDILRDLSDSQRAKVVDALQPVHFPEGDIIIKEGDQGESFYLLLDGVAIAEKDGAVLKHFKKNSFFGELALLRDEPRAATVYADTDCECATLDRESFMRLLGPLESFQHRAQSRNQSVRSSVKGSVQGSSRKQAPIDSHDAHGSTDETMVLMDNTWVSVSTVPKDQLAPKHESAANHGSQRSHLSSSRKSTRSCFDESPERNQSPPKEQVLSHRSASQTGQQQSRQTESSRRQPESQPVAKGSKRRDESVHSNKSADEGTEILDQDGSTWRPAGSLPRSQSGSQRQSRLEPGPKDDGLQKNSMSGLQKSSMSDGNRSDASMMMVDGKWSPIDGSPARRVSRHGDGKYVPSDGKSGRHVSSHSCSDSANVNAEGFNFDADVSQTMVDGRWVPLATSKVSSSRRSKHESPDVQSESLRNRIQQAYDDDEGTVIMVDGKWVPVSEQKVASNRRSVKDACDHSSEESMVLVEGRGSVPNSLMQGSPPKSHQSSHRLSASNSKLSRNAEQLPSFCRNSTGNSKRQMGNRSSTANGKPSSSLPIEEDETEVMQEGAWVSRSAMDAKGQKASAYTKGERSAPPGQDDEDGSDCSSVDEGTKVMVNDNWMPARDIPNESHRKSQQHQPHKEKQAVGQSKNSQGKFAYGATKRMWHPCDVKWVVLECRKGETPTSPSTTYIKKFKERNIPDTNHAHIKLGGCAVGDKLVAINGLHLEHEDEETLDTIWADEALEGQDLELLFR